MAYYHRYDEHARELFNLVDNLFVVVTCES
jgi:hypothetical protein